MREKVRKWYLPEISQQIDQPYLDSQSNGLVYMIDRMKDQNIFAHVNLLKGERSELSELASNLL